ncbi:hypothetical protein HQ602_13035 [Rhodococcus kroppenstedtii]|uniref:hypothetical protein n=1 Tax=Rhodococcoides kroppenstedtii TaxID=293050 RepID=UPI001C9A9C14|nr:hypothetical protein [Rhodococcus kroppenstedtii]MBY6437304.1 hypothetical protein [Rhodococcus kroppenstedtii]
MTASTETTAAMAAVDDAAVGDPRPGRRWDVLVGVLAAVTVVGLATLAQWRGTLFFYVGDMYEQFAPLWHVFGSQLRSGQWVAMDPAAWMGGNYAAEALNGIWNPVNLANFVLVSYFDNLSLAAFVVATEMLAILAIGVYLLARTYGAHRGPSFLIAVAIPVSGLTLWYEAAGWPAGLAAFTWFVHFWWSARRFALGRLPMIVPFAFGFLAMTAGNPYAPLGLVVVLAALGIELILRRDVGRLLLLTLMGACVGAVALMVFLPLLGASEVTTRQSLAAIANDTFLVPDLGDLAAGSSPTYLPSIANWKGPLDSVPSTYLAWFVLPLLPWLRWSDRRAISGGVGLAVVGAFYLIATLAPSNLWLFRWPFRLVEYLYLVLALGFAVLLSRGLAPVTRRRVGATVGIVAFGAYSAWAVRPDLGLEHLVGLTVVGAGVAAAVVAGRRAGIVALVAVAVVVTGVVSMVQFSAFPSVAQPITSDDESRPAPLPDGGSPVFSVADMRRGAIEYRGVVLQLADRLSVTTEDTREGRLLFGNLARVADLGAVTSYTGMGFDAFADELCMDYRGAVCGDAVERIFAPASANIDAPLVDVMGVSTLVIQRTLAPRVSDGPPPIGWRVAAADVARVVWVRDSPIAASAGPVTWSSAGIDAETRADSPMTETVDVNADRAGTVVFSRLAWPGYTATVDGRPVEVAEGPAGLLEVEVPAGDGLLRVEYTPPGLAFGRAAALAATVIVVLASVATSLMGRRRRSVANAGLAGPH